MRLALLAAAAVLGSTAVAAGDVAIGRVAGHEIEASTLLDRRDMQLHDLAGRVPPDVFESQARLLLAGDLREVVINVVMLDDAERALTDEQRATVDHLAAKIRKQMVDEHGAGDATTADLRMRRDTGRGLEAEVTQQRNRIVMRQRIDELFAGKTRIGPDDIRREYDRRLDKYVTPALRDVRIISTQDAHTADQIDEALAAGRPFAEIAASGLNTFRPMSGGMIPKPVAGEDGMVEPINSTMLALAAGAHSGRIVLEKGFVWVQVERITPQRVVPLEEAREQIESDLQAERYHELMEQYVKRVLAESEHTDMEQMLNAVVNAAMHRYLRPGKQERAEGRTE